jgi:hypothetical protein
MEASGDAALPWVEAKCTGRRARGVTIVAAVLWAAVVASTLATVAFWEKAHAPNADEQMAFADLIRVAPLPISALACLAGILSYMAATAMRAARVWRGVSILVSSEGLTIAGPDGSRRYAWTDVERVPTRYGRGLVVVTQDGRTTDVPFAAVDEWQGAFGGEPSRMRLPNLLPIVARAYWHASRSGLRTALAEPPRLLTGHPRPSRARLRRELAWAVPMGLAMLGVPTAAAALGSLLDGTPREAAAIAITGIMGMALLGTVMVFAARDRLMVRVHIGRRGLAVRAAGGRYDVWPWDQVESVTPSRTFGGRTSIVIHAGGRRLTRRGVGRVLDANLALLSRLEWHGSSNMLVEACRYYTNGS